jgi:hypothetical protein
VGEDLVAQRVKGIDLGWRQPLAGALAGEQVFIRLLVGALAG